MENVKFVFDSKVGNKVSAILNGAINKNEGSLKTNANYLLIRNNYLCCKEDIYNQFVHQIKLKNSYQFVVMVSGFMEFEFSPRKPFLWAFVVERGIVKAKYSMSFYVKPGYESYSAYYKPTGLKLRWDNLSISIETNNNKNIKYTNREKEKRMAEFCKECFLDMNKNVKENELEMTEDNDICEGCCKYAPVVKRINKGGSK